jgi:Putative adhesin
MPTFDTPGPIAVTVELGVGDVRLQATDRTDTTVEVRPSDPRKKGDVAAAEQTQVEFRNGHLSVRGPKGWRQWLPHRGNESIDVRIEVPAGSRLDLDAGVATLRGSGSLGAVHCKVGVGEIRLDRTGPLDVRSGMGDISVEHAAGKADVSTGSGTLRIDAIEGHAVIKNSNGDTWIGEISGTARVSAANGDIAIDVARAGVHAKTAMGAVRLGEVATGDVVAQTAAGDLDVGVRAGVAAWLDLDTKFGHVRNDLEASEAPVTGDSTVSVHAGTSFGDISIHRSFGSEGREAS